MPCLEAKLFSYERGVMKRNEGRNERSGMKDTGSCPNEGGGTANGVTNLRSNPRLPELAKVCRRALQLKAYHKSDIKIYAFYCNGLAHLFADDDVERQYYLAGWVLCVGDNF